MLHILAVMLLCHRRWGDAIFAMMRIFESLAEEFPGDPRVSSSCRSREMADIAKIISTITSAWHLIIFAGIACSSEGRGRTFVRTPSQLAVVES